MKTKLTKLEKSWILYDIGNSAFILLVTALLPIYFGELADLAGVDENLRLSYRGYAESLSTIIVALIAPIVNLRLCAESALISSKVLFSKSKIRSA